MTDAIYSTADVYYKTGYEQGKADMLKKINDIKAEIRQKQWHLGVDNTNNVIEIIDKHIGEQNEQS